MKLENCGRCGHEAALSDVSENVAPCPCCGNEESRQEYDLPARWNQNQRRIRTERINAASLEFMSVGFPHGMGGEGAIRLAEELIDAQDAAAQARFRAMQGGA